MENPALQLLQAGTRLEAQLLDQGRPSGAVGLERLGLPARAIQGDDQELVDALAQRMLSRKVPEVGQQVARGARVRARPRAGAPRQQSQLLSRAATGCTDGSSVRSASAGPAHRSSAAESAVAASSKSWRSSARLPSSARRSNRDRSSASGPTLTA